MNTKRGFVLVLKEKDSTILVNLLANMPTLCASICLLWEGRPTTVVSPPLLLSHCFRK